MNLKTNMMNILPAEEKNDEYTAKYIKRQLNINKQEILSKDHSQCPQNTSKMTFNLLRLNGRTKLLK